MTQSAPADTRPQQRCGVGLAILLALLAGPPCFPGRSMAASETISVPLFSPRIPARARLVDQWSWGGDRGGIRPVAIDLHPSGLVAGIEGRLHRIFLADADGGWIGFGDQGIADLDFGFASRIYARSGLQIFALDPERRVVDQYSLRANWQSQLDLEAAAFAAGEELGEIVDLCLDRAGNLLLLDAGKGRILRFSGFGALQQVLRTWGDWVLKAPIALEVDGRGRLYVLETQPPELVVLDADGRLLERRPVLDDGGDPLEPSALVVDPWGSAFIADSRAGAVRVLPVAGAAPWWVRPPGEQRMQAADLAVDEMARLLVADAEAACIWVFALDYEAKAASHGPGREP